MHLHLDASSGAAGDMLLAACLDLGADEAGLQAALDALKVPDWSLKVERVMRSGLQATQVTVSEPHEHTHHPHPHHDSSPHSHSHGPHRHLADLLEILAHAPLSPAVLGRAERVFRRLAEAEAHVHGTTPEQVHFHEVSGVDTLIDVVGTLLALEQLEVHSISCWPVVVGSGTVRSAHGLLPVPAPATLEILTSRRIPFEQGGLEGEFLTPTGAALLAEVVDHFAPCPLLIPERVGCGAGHRALPDRPNVLRAILGARPGEAEESDQIVEYRATIDDMTAEEAAFAIEEALTAGALDAYAAPVTMKKGRPGLELTILAPQELTTAVERALFTHTSTLGLRRQPITRRILARKMIEVEVEGWPIRIKEGLLDGEIITRHPEYDDCSAAAKGLRKPLREIIQRALHQPVAP